MKKEFDVLVIGCGPAGITAASICAQYNVSVALVDMERAPGGRVLKDVEDGFNLKHTTFMETRDSRRLLARFGDSKSKITYFQGSVLTDINRKTALIDGPEGQFEVTAKAFILAPGALEAPAVFPGWTSPGVYTLGSYNSMIKRGQKLNERVLVAGSGPLLYALAANVKKGGGKLAGIIDAASFSDNVSLGLTLVKSKYYSKMSIAMKGGLSLLSSKWKTRCRVTSVEGEAGNFTVRTTMMDDNWNSTTVGPTFSVDAVAVSYGLHPNTDLSRRCECKHTYNPFMGIWLPVLDSCLRTSQDGIYVAGDAALVKGYEGAQVDGEIAALAALIDMGKGQGLERKLFDLQKYRRTCELFSEKLTDIAEPGPGYFAELDDSVVICRCESITIKDIKRAVAEGARDKNGIKKRIRLGMGHCQGRYCGQLIDRLLSQIAGANHTPADYTPRTPAQPVRIGVLAGESMPVDIEFRQ